MLVHAKHLGSLPVHTNDGSEFKAVDFLVDKLDYSIDSVVAKEKGLMKLTKYYCSKGDILSVCHDEGIKINLSAENLRKSLKTNLPTLGDCWKYFGSVGMFDPEVVEDPVMMRYICIQLGESAADYGFGSHLINTRVKGLDGPLGTIQDICYDAKSLAVKYFVLDLGWGEKTLLKPSWIESLKWTEKVAYVNAYSHDFKDGPIFYVDDEIEEAFEKEVEHFHKDQNEERPLL